MRKLALAAVAATVTAATLFAPAVASATPARGVTATVLSQWTAGHTDYVLRKITIAPGSSDSPGTTGWHTHEGNLYGRVLEGTLTHYKSDCSVDGVYHQGDSIMEPAGADHVHEGRNEGTTPMVLEVLYVLPHGAPLADDAPNPGCSFD
ncbi:cupin domain-containing protein [Amycolatopsis rhabdoformis]|uniref:Cupin domain-containing protein n=1 Tax=Amycolatopsis rhabdoformis TaxID=1448059 RepID=A0ABZ1I0I2_9PSEU|nr:cupin domain-containing protein [Amycolatopsis rhabdoformis]WSE27901.1 cupin domain-containing protein [Amycolatopsis rhabdoformis]